MKTFNIPTSNIQNFNVYVYTCIYFSHNRYRLHTSCGFVDIQHQAHMSVTLRFQNIFYSAGLLPHDVTKLSFYFYLK